MAEVGIYLKNYENNDQIKIISSSDKIDEALAELNEYGVVYELIRIYKKFYTRCCMM